MLTPAALRDDPRVDDPCVLIRTLSFAACDRELSPHDAQAIESHLLRCTPCRSLYLADAVFVRAVRRGAAIDAAPAALRERIAPFLQRRATEHAPT
jgi:predicted anti-sigma-YlaC factor YlaD